MAKKLYLSDQDKKICGVCGGLGEYLNIDSTVVRLIAVILAICSLGTAIVAYIVCALVMPKDPGYTDI